MATGRKKRRYSSITSSDDSAECLSKMSRRQVQVSVFDKWKRGLDRQCNTNTWLCCDVGKKSGSLVSSMYWKVCREYEDRIIG